MAESTPAPRRDRRILAAILFIAIVAIGGILVQRLLSLGDLVGVVVEGEEGTILLAGEEPVSERVQFLVGPGDPRLVLVPAETSAGSGWEVVAGALLPGIRVVSVGLPTVTRRTSGTGGARREVIALRTRLVLEDAEGTRSPALGIGAGLVHASDPAPRVARTIVRFAGPGGEFLAVDGEPLFHDEPPGIADRLRGSPGHIVLFDLVEIDESSRKAAGDPTANDPDEGTLRAIDRLRREKPERGVVPEPSEGGAGDAAPPAPGGG